MARASSPETDLIELLSRPGARAAEISAILDPLSPGDRILAVRSLGGRRLQRALWNAVADSPRLSTAELIPADHPPMKPVVFHGKNSLPAFSEFRKIACRPDDPAAGDVLWGYNDTPIMALIGPGYYVVHDTPASPLGGAAFDYTKLPEARAPGWPEIRPNDRRLSRFVYHGTVDYMRRVAGDVFIGTATRSEHELGSYFVLARETN
jgi:hypothetical protein